MSPIKRAYIELHFAVLLFGFTAILGNLIQLNALMLVWWRVGITSLSLLFLLSRDKNKRKLSRRDIVWIIGIGIIVTIHWLSFYGAIKVSNASIALISFATTSFFTAILEPLITRQQAKWTELALGLLILPGMFLIVESVQWDQIQGVILGVFSALMAALFGTLNKVQISKDIHPFTLTFVQLGSSWLFMSLFLIIANPISGWIDFTFFPPRLEDWIYLIILSLVCTTLGYVLMLRALRHVSAFTSSLTINLEPVYGITLAWIILGEDKQLSTSFYYGSAVIALAVFLYPFMRQKERFA